MHRVEGRVRRNENVALDAGERTVRRDEAVAVGVAAETAGDVLGIEAREAVVAAAKFHETAVADQGFEGLRKGGVFLAANA